MKITVVRKEFANDRTFGDMYLDGQFFCNTLEPHAIDWSREQKVAGKTAIPEGTYKVRLGWSTKWGRTVPWLRKVPHFRDIQIHVGNFPKDTRGCILVGDQDKDVLIGSRLVFDRLMLKLRNEAEIWIEVRNEAEAPEAPSDSPKGERTEEGTPIVGADRCVCPTAESRTTAEDTDGGFESDSTKGEKTEVEYNEVLEKFL
ncbi:MAG: DUF5675 family protein [Prevotella sp.]